jgi:hypothetical protein
MCPHATIYVSSYFFFFEILAQIEQARLEGVQSLPQQIAALEGQVQQLKAAYTSTSSLRPHTLVA